MSDTKSNSGTNPSSSASSAHGLTTVGMLADLASPETRSDVSTTDELPAGLPRFDDMREER